MLWTGTFQDTRICVLDTGEEQGKRWQLYLPGAYILEGEQSKQLQVVLSTKRKQSRIKEGVIDKSLAWCWTHALQAITPDMYQPNAFSTALS